MPEHCWKSFRDLCANGSGQCTAQIPFYTSLPPPSVLGQHREHLAACGQFQCAGHQLDISTMLEKQWA